MINYTLQFTEPWAHLVDVTIDIPVDAATEALELWMPVWTPGSYLVREFSRQVEGLEITGADGDPLPWRQTAKNSWGVDTSGQSRIHVRYRIYGREMSVRTNWIEDGFCLLNGAATFLVPRGAESQPLGVRVRIPDAWAGVWTGLPADAKHTVDGETNRVAAFVADDLDMLIDCPIAAGSPAVHDFTVDSVPFHLVNFEEGGLWDGAKAARDVAKIVDAYRAMYGGLPFERYWFLNYITEARGGLEHKNSCVMMTSRYTYRTRKAYVDWLGLASHEFFHVWNVKRSRPVTLGPFDYESENYTRALWVAEGITAYYTDLMPCRAGVATADEFLVEFSRLIKTLQSTPGRHQQSLETSSFNAWIKLYRPDENTVNSTVSYYLKGAIVSWLLDASIRRASNHTRSLDDVMRRLYAEFSGDQGFTDADLRTVVNEAAGADLTAFFAHAVESTRELDYAPALETFGLRFKPVDTGDSFPPVWMGITSKAVDGRLVVSTVVADGPARDAGVNAEDEILAVGGYRVTPGALEERLRQYAPGDRLEILISRRDAVRHVMLTLAEHPGDPWRLEFDPEASKMAQVVRTTWLGQARD